MFLNDVNAALFRKEPFLGGQEDVKRKKTCYKCTYQL